MNFSTHPKAKAPEDFRPRNPDPTPQPPREWAGLTAPARRRLLAPSRTTPGLSPPRWKIRRGGFFFCSRQGHVRISTFNSRANVAQALAHIAAALR